MASKSQTNRFLYEARREHDACGIGAVVNIDGARSHRILELGNQIVLNLQHRGASGSDETTGDGSGILFQIPHEFFAEEVGKLGVTLPERGRYGVAMVFGPKDSDLRGKCEELLEQAVAYYGLKVLGWRDVPGEATCLGELARAAEPSIRQMFIDGNGRQEEVLERSVYLARKRAERLSSEKFGKRSVIVN
ncbi:MAG: hypothetical protein K8R91_05265 [Phycisphaerae bacterium]|nr:hypothetical protein [Phycisphaerae bacterium]